MKFEFILDDEQILRQQGEFYEFGFRDACCLDIILLATRSYFSLVPVDSVEFGLQGVVVESKFITYADLANNCTLPLYCEYVPDFKRSGSLLQGLLIVDIFLLVAVITAKYRPVVNAQKGDNSKETMDTCKKNALQTIVCGKNLLYLHPVLINLGMVLWSNYTKLSDLSNKMNLHEGIISLIIQCFLSLLIIAYNVWLNGSIKRRNLRLLRSTSYKREDVSIPI